MTEAQDPTAIMIACFAIFVGFLVTVGFVIQLLKHSKETHSYEEKQEQDKRRINAAIDDATEAIKECRLAASLKK